LRLERAHQLDGRFGESDSRRLQRLVPAVPVVVGQSRDGSSAHQQRMQREIEMRERVLDDLEHSLGRDGRAEHARTPVAR